MRPIGLGSCLHLQGDVRAELSDSGRGPKEGLSRRVAFASSGLMPGNALSNVESAYPRRWQPSASGIRVLPQFEATLVSH